MNANTILITGGAGFIGSIAGSMLQLEGFQTIVLDNLSSGSSDSVHAGLFIKGDIGDKALLDEIFTRHKITAVMHFAASIDVGESVRDPALYYHNNVTNTLILLDAMRRANVQNFIFSSSAAVYGIPENEILDETHSCNPINPYGESKLIIEKVLKDYQAAYGFKSCSLRYFNAAGGDHSGKIKYAQKKQGNLIPIILNCFLKNEPFTIFGSDYATHDGTCVRDYVHVADLGNAHILALKKLLSGNASLCYNLGNRQGSSIWDVIHAAEEVTGRKLDVIMGPRRAGDPAKLIADPTKAQKELRWKPAYPEIKEMIKHAWSARIK